MPSPLVTTLPAGDDELRTNVERQLSPYAEVQTAPAEFGLAETVLIVELIAATAATAASVAQIVQVLLELKDRSRQRGGLSGIHGAAHLGR